MSAIGLTGLIFSKYPLSSNTFKRSVHLHFSSSSTLRRMCKMESLFCLGEVLRGGGFKSGEGLFSLSRSNPVVLSTAVSASWSMIILLCFKKGRPSKILIQRFFAKRARTGRDVHALLREDSVRTT